MADFPLTPERGGLLLNPIYVFAAGHGQCAAQIGLAVGCCDHALAIGDDDPELANEYLMAAEMFAELACAHGGANEVAVLAGILVARSIHLTLLDPVRSLEYRERAELLFDAVENASNSQASGIIAYALNKLADADPDDDRATVRLNRIVESLAPGEAQLLREAVRSVSRETQGELHA